MPVPTLITELSTTAASNYPAGTDSPATLDDVQRAHGAFIAQLRDDPTANSSVVIAIAKGGTGASTAAAARTALGAAASGALASSGITGAAASGANSDITSLASPAIAAATATTQAATDSTTKVATTAFVRQFKQLAQIIASSTGAYSTSTGVIPADNTIPQNTEGTQVLTASITPTNASSTLEVCVTVYMTNAGVAFIGAALFRDAGVGAVASGLTYSAAGNALYPITFTYLVSAGSTAATTFNVRCGSTSGAWYLNGNSVGQLWGGVLSSSITIKEYLP